MSGTFPFGGNAWMREIERRLMILGRHNHPDPVTTDPIAAMIARAKDGWCLAGVRRASATGISWTGQVRIINSGNHAAIPGGFIGIGMPADGVVIPVHGSIGTSSVTVAAGEIPIPANSTLYYDAPLDGLSTTGFHIVGFDGNYVMIPPRWVKVVQRITAGSVNPVPYLWGDGYLQDYERAPALLNSWVNYSPAFADATYTRAGGMTVLSGMVALGTVSTGATGNMFVLPVGFRPASIRMLFDVQANAAVGRVDVFSTGEVRAISGGNAFFSLDSIRFPYAQ